MSKTKEKVSRNITVAVRAKKTKRVTLDDVNEINDLNDLEKAKQQLFTMRKQYSEIVTNHGELVQKLRNWFFSWIDDYRFGRNNEETPPQTMSLTEIEVMRNEAIQLKDKYQKLHQVLNNLDKQINLWLGNYLKQYYYNQLGGGEVGMEMFDELWTKFEEQLVMEKFNRAYKFDGHNEFGFEWRDFTRSVQPKVVLKYKKGKPEIEYTLKDLLIYIQPHTQGANRDLNMDMILEDDEVTLE